jgi:glutamine synthetase
MKKLVVFVVALMFVGTKGSAAHPEAQNPLAKFNYMDCWYLDILAHPKCITLPMDKAQQACKYGIFFDGSSVIGFTSINESDLLALPDTSSLFVFPWGTQDMSTLVVMCDVCTKDGSLHPDSSRTVLKNAVERAYEAGFVPYCGVEVEFYLLKKDKNGQLTPLDQYGYCDAIPGYQHKAFQFALMDLLKKSGIDVEKIHHEVAPGQYEVVIKYTNPVRAADSLVMTKFIIQSVAEAHEFQATFMPKPFAHYNGSGMHIHMSFFDAYTNTNAFYDAYQDDNLSVTAQQFIAGNLNRLKEYELLLNTSVNSFKRLVPGYEAPVYVCWGRKNRSAALRIPDTTPTSLAVTNGAPMRVEFRIPDGSCNPYLAFAALIEAGLQGIKNQEVAPASIEQNLYHYSEEQIEELGITTIVTSLGEAIDLYKDSAFTQSLLGVSLHKKILDIKEREWNSYTKNEVHNAFVITDWEKKQHALLEQN